MTFKELIEICENAPGRLYAKDKNGIDEVFFYYCKLPDEDNPNQEVWIDIDSYDENEVVHETAKEIVKNLSCKSNDVSCANDDDNVFILYTDELNEVVGYEVKNGNVYLLTK